MTITQVDTTIGRRLKAARVLAGIDQMGIAQRLGVSQSTVSAWESGKSEPQASQFIGWSRVTGQTLAWLAEGVNTRKAPADNSEGLIARPEGFEPPTF